MNIRCVILINMQTDISSQPTIKPSGPVCLYFHDLVPSVSHDIDNRKWHGSMQLDYMDLLQGASAGCSRCEFILQIFQKYEPVSKGYESYAHAEFEFSSSLSTKPDHTKSVHESVPGSALVWLSTALSMPPRPFFDIYTLQGK